MTYDEFILSVQEKSGLARDEAEESSQTFMDLLSQKLSRDEITSLSGQLPAELCFALQEGLSAKRRFTVNEFFEQISYSARVRREDVIAVWETLSEAVSARDLEQIRAKLPKAFGQLVD